MRQHSVHARTLTLGGRRRRVEWILCVSRACACVRVCAVQGDARALLKCEFDATTLRRLTLVDRCYLYYYYNNNNYYYYYKYFYYHF